MITYESTPNPQAMKFNLDRFVADETVYFDDPNKTVRSPLAQKLFGFPWAQAIMIGPNYVTVTKQGWVEWDILADPLSDLIFEHLESDEAVLLKPSENQVDAVVGGAHQLLADDSETVKTIKTILDQEIRPAVAQDGGDILFDRYEAGRLYLRLQGACSGCPSSMMTLKEGVEVRMKEMIPELIEVISV